MNFTKVLKKTHLQFLINHIDIIIFFVILFYKSKYFIKKISPIYFDSLTISYTSAACIIIVISLSILLKSNIRFYYLYIIDIFINLLYLLDIIYYKTNSDLVSLISIKNGTLTNLLNHSPFTILNISDYLFLIDLIIMPIFKHFILKPKNIRINYLFRVLICIFMITIGIKLDMPYIKKLDKEQPGLLKNMSNKLYVARTTGILNYHVIDTYNYFIRNKQNNYTNYNVNEIKSFFNDKQCKNNKYTGIGNDKNLIIIQVESLQNFLINKKFNGTEITPNLNKFIKKSVYFSNCFYQVMEGNTSDAEFLCNNSLYPSSNGAVYYKYAGNQFNSLPNLLKEKGYSNYVFHGNNEGFWNRQVMYTAQGFDKFFGINTLNSEKEYGMGISDESFLTQSFDKIQTFKEPFYSFIITLTSHFPFTDVEKIFDTGAFKDSFIGNYINSIHYTDKQLGMFLEQLQDSNILDNSIVVIYGDHNGITPDKEKDLYSFEGLNNPNNATKFLYKQVPLLIHFPKDKYKGINSNFVGQIDIYPTLANIFDICNPYVFGKDMFDSSSNSNKVLFNNGSFTYKNTLYISYLDKYYDLNTKKEIYPSNNLLEIKSKFQREIFYSQVLLQQDLIRNFSIEK